MASNSRPDSWTPNQWADVSTRIGGARPGSAEKGSWVGSGGVAESDETADGLEVLPSERVEADAEQGSAVTVLDQQGTPAITPAAVKILALLQQELK